MSGVHPEQDEHPFLAPDGVRNVEHAHASGPVGVAVQSPHEAFGDITALALRLLAVSGAIVTLSDGASAYRQASSEGLHAIEPGSDSLVGICDTVRPDGEPVVLNDAAEAGYPDLALGGLPVRALASFPLLGRDGACLGALCVTEDRPRAWTREDLRSLDSLARLAATQIELHHARADSRRHSAELDRERQARASLLEQLPDGFFAVDAHWRLSYVNRRAERLMGRAANELIGKVLWDEFPALLGNRFERELTRAHAEASRVEFEEHNRADGHWYGVTAYPMGGGLVVYFRDVTDRHRIDARVMRYREVFAHSEDAIAILDLDGRYLEQNAAHQRLAGYTDEELRETTAAIHLGDEALDRIERGLRERGAYRGEEVGRHKDGHEVIMDLSIFTVLDDRTQEPVCYVGLARDITQRKALEEKERELIREQAARAEAESSHRRMAAMLESITDAFFALDDEWRFTYVNGQAEVVLQRARDELIGRSVWQELHLDEKSTFRKGLTRALSEDVNVDFEAVLPHLDSWFQVHAYPADGGLSVFLHDVTERKAALERLRRDALHDPLTGLANRVQFMERLSRYVERADRRRAYQYAVLFMDLDRFKIINDSLGHVVGDELLVQIARRLEGCIRAVDMVARFGGDEFAILLHDIDGPEDALHVAERIEAALERPLNPAGYQVYTSGSIGITLSSNGYTSREEVLRDADTAMYRAKSTGARYTIFDSTMHEVALSRLHLESELRPALELEQMRTFYQPLVDLETGRLAGFEALLRWEHPTRGLLAPREFVPMAEETGLIVSIGWWAMEQAAAALASWRGAAPDHPLQVNINISGRQLVQEDLVARVQGVLDRHALPADVVALEITESVLMKNPDVVSGTLAELKRRGVRLCIDDFGTGYSSFTYLHRFPVDTLKIDRTFVNRMGVEPGSREIVQAMISLAHSLGLRAIAEGVENRHQLELLRPLRPPYAQGYLFGRPMSADDALELVRGGAQFVEMTA